MEDQELLEAAAKAAGLSVYFDDAGQCCKRQPRDPMGTWLWNPLEDDGDALRLAVKLRLEVDCEHDPICVGTSEMGVRERQEADPYAATRRAIVRAAAAMATPAP